MQKYLKILLFSFVFLNPFVNTVSSEESLALPEIQWGKDLEIGYISTAPLVVDGIIIVKGGGDSNLGINSTIIAYRADNGSEIWRSDFKESIYNFEISPLLLVRSGSWSCSPNLDLIVTGWTSGSVTAHDLRTGTLVWEINSSAPSWGITGGGVEIEGRIIWPTETGIIELCASDGNILNQYEDPEIRTYRANIGYWFSYENDSRTIRGFLQGTEKGQILTYDLNLTLINKFEIPKISNLSGLWKIRSTPVMYQFSSESSNLTTLLTHLQGQDESRLVHLNWTDNLTPLLIESYILGPGSATSDAGQENFLWGSSTEILKFSITNFGEIEETFRWNVSDVTGEIKPILIGNITGYCFPQNNAEGSWYITTDIGTTIWAPEKIGWLTAGCGSDSNVMAGANDASWLEVRFSSTNLELIAMIIDEALGLESESTLNNESDSELEIDESEQSNPINTSEQNILVFIYFGFSVFIIFVIIIFLVNRNNNERKILENIDSKHIISVVVLITVVIIFPQINKFWLDSTEDARSRLITIENNSYYGLPSEWENKQVICIYFPSEFVTQNMTASKFSEDRIFLNVDGSEILIDANSEDKVNFSEDIATGVCIGGFENYTSGFNFMLDATNVVVEGLEVSYDNSVWGPYVHTIGGLNANKLTGNFSGAYWALYHNGLMSDVGIGDLVLSENSVIIWKLATYS